MIHQNSNALEWPVKYFTGELNYLSKYFAGTQLILSPFGDNNMMVSMVMTRVWKPLRMLTVNES